jgi:hypothetical protein
VLDQQEQAPAEQVNQPAPEEEVVAPPEHSILRDIETASETIALYTAIIGKRLEIVPPSEEEFSEDGPLPIMSISPNWPHVNRQLISIWFRRMSLHARKRIDQAIMRIAS